MGDVTLESLKENLEKLRANREQLAANLQAQNGAIQFCEHLIAQLSANGNKEET